MSIAKVIEVSSESPNSFDEAVRNAVQEVQRTIKNVRHVWVKEFQAEVRDDGSLVYRTHCKITFVVNHDEG